MCLHLLLPPLEPRNPHLCPGSAVLGGWSLPGPAGIFKTSSLAVQMARSCAATRVPSQVSGRGSVFSYV